MRTFTTMAVAVTAIGAALLTAPASAAFLTPNGFSVQGWANDANVAVNGVIADMADGNTTTGLTFTATRPQFASGVRGEFTYDISGFTAITGFTFTAKVVADFGLATEFNALRLGSDIIPFNTFTTFGMPSGTLVTATLSPVAGGANFNALSDYISGATLTVAFSTNVSTATVTTPISLSFRELSLEIFGDRVVEPPVPVPAPGSLPLFAAFLGLGALALRRRAG